MLDLNGLDLTGRDRDRRCNLWSCSTIIRMNKVCPAQFSNLKLDCLRRHGYGMGQEHACYAKVAVPPFIRDYWPMSQVLHVRASCERVIEITYSKNQKARGQRLQTIFIKDTSTNSQWAILCNCKTWRTMRMKQLPSVTEL